MRGTYTLRRDGKIVSVSKNIVTTEGRKEMLRFLAGQRSGLGAVLAVGAGTTAASVNDTQLAFEAARTLVSLSSPDFINNAVIFKGILPQEVVGRFYEIGLFSSGQENTTHRTLLSFDSLRETWSTGVQSSTNNRFDFESLRVDSNTNTTTTTTLVGFTNDLVNMTQEENFVFAFTMIDPNLDEVTLRFSALGTGNTLSYTVATPVQGYNVIRVKKGAFVATGNATWGNIVSVSILVKANVTDWVPVDPDGAGPQSAPPGLGYTGTRAFLDRLVVEPAPGVGNILISRSVMPEYQKNNLAPLEIEYYLELTN